MSIGSVRSFLYLLGRLLDDMNAVGRGRASRRWVGVYDQTTKSTDYPFAIPFVLNSNPRR